MMFNDGALMSEMQEDMMAMTPSMMVSMNSNPDGSMSGGAIGTTMKANLKA